MMMKARCTTTSAPFTSASTSSRLVTSPWTYSVFLSPIDSGSNGRRAIPMTFLIWGVLSSARSSGLPMSPVGPVTATLSFAADDDEREVVRFLAGGMRPRTLSRGDHVELVGPPGAGRLAVQQPFVGRPARQRAALLELAESCGDRGAAGADELGEHAMRQRQVDRDALGRDAAPAPGEVPQQRQHADVHPRDVDDGLQQ